MSYHYQMNSTGNEFFDSTGYVPQIQMHHDYQDYYTPDTTVMTSAVAEVPLMSTDHLSYSTPWRHESWNTTSTSSSTQWMGIDLNASQMTTGTSSDSFTHCYVDPTPRIVPKKSQPLPPPTLPPLPPRTRSMPKPFRCNICGKAFSQAANLTAHKRIHTGEKPFMCPVCNRPFSQSSSLVTHRRTHTGERPYPCAQCDKAFTDSSTLTKHLRTHTGQKPYICTICMMKFTQSGNLHRHMKTHK